MAKRDNPKTSLGNVLDNSPTKPETPQPVPSRWRSVSESSAQPPRPKLFRSVREAMEFEAAEEQKAPREATMTTSTRTLDARMLSTLENTQADQAGYTVIRRRAISDPSAPHEQHTRAGSGRKGDATDRRRGKSARERRQESGDGSRRGDAVVASSSSTRRPSKRSPMSVPATVPSNVWAPTTQAKAANEAVSEAQRWLAAASAGAVLPAGATPSTPVPSVTSGTSSPLASSGSSAWSSPVMLKEHIVPASSQLPADATKQVPHEDAAVLDESMLSWLESALALDETRASSASHEQSTGSDATRSADAG